ncbi:hypothetical protein D3C86_1884690 [compost metagenome]
MVAPFHVRLGFIFRADTQVALHPNFGHFDFIIFSYSCHCRSTGIATINGIVERDVFSRDKQIKKTLRLLLR